MMFQAIGLKDHFDFFISNKSYFNIFDTKASLFLPLLRLLLISFKILIWIKIKNFLEDIGMNIKS